MFPPSLPPESKPLVKKPSKKKPEKSNFWSVFLTWMFVVLGIAAITAMIMFNSKEKPLTCRNTVRGANSLTSFGTCTTD